MAGKTLIYLNTVLLNCCLYFTANLMLSCNMVQIILHNCYV